jgi:hypothetical protein
MMYSLHTRYCLALEGIRIEVALAQTAAGAFGKRRWRGRRRHQLVLSLPHADNKQ